MNQDEAAIGKTVFVVESNVALSESILQMLVSENFQALYYQTAKGFLDEYNGQPGCLIANMNLPEMSGPQMLQELIRRRQRLPILFISGSSRISDVVDALRSGALDVIETPFSRVDLIKRVEDALENCERMLQFEERLSQLSNREQEFLELLVVGKSVKDISAMLNISPKTGHIHRSNVLKKMQRANVAELSHAYHVHFQLGLARAKAPRLDNN